MVILQLFIFQLFIVIVYRYSRLPCIRDENKITGFRVETFIDKTHRKRVKRNTKKPSFDFSPFADDFELFPPMKWLYVYVRSLKNQ